MSFEVITLASGRRFCILRIRSCLYQYATNIGFPLPLPPNLPKHRISCHEWKSLFYLLHKQHHLPSVIITFWEAPLSFVASSSSSPMERTISFKWLNQFLSWHSYSLPHGSLFVPAYLNNRLPFMEIQIHL